MKLNEGFLDSMKEAFARFKEHDPAAATDLIRRALSGESTHVEPPQAQRPEQAKVDTTPFGRFHKTRTETDAAVEDRGHFSRKSYANAAGQRDYKLYVPSGYRGEPVPLIVMLHGCTQDADDFAAGTQMNTLADEHGCIVVYPIQPQGANPSKCWNWFKPADQARERGEPSLIAGITREVMASHSVDPKRVYVAGLSAGGAMAAILAQTYPDLYAAAGVHSGLAAGSAHDLPSALAAMRGGQRPGHAKTTTQPSRCPLIVFHGDADTTVHHANADAILRGFSVDTAASAAPASDIVSTRKCTVRKLVSPEGTRAEFWTIHGAPHAWSGGSSRGSYTDPTGPDASAAMLRFFLAHPRQH